MKSKSMLRPITELQERCNAKFGPFLPSFIISECTLACYVWQVMRSGKEGN